MRSPKCRALLSNRCRDKPVQVLRAVRALGRKLEVDLNLVQATGPDGTITGADVERAAKSLSEAGPAEPLRHAAGHGAAHGGSPHRSGFGKKLISVTGTPTASGSTPLDHV